MASVVGKSDLLWCVRFDPLFVRSVVQCFVLVGEMVVMLKMCQSSQLVRTSPITSNSGGVRLLYLAAASVA